MTQKKRTVDEIVAIIVDKHRASVQAQTNEPAPEATPDEIKNVKVQVSHILDNTSITPEDLHNINIKPLVDAGWKIGDHNEDEKTTPSVAPLNHLDASVREGYQTLIDIVNELKVYDENEAATAGAATPAGEATAGAATPASEATAGAATPAGEATAGAAN